MNSSSLAGSGVAALNIPLSDCSGTAVAGAPDRQPGSAAAGGPAAGLPLLGISGTSLATREVMLRKLLFGSTALIGAVMLAGTASAQTAGPKAPFTAILDGEVDGNVGILGGTQNSGANNGHQRDFGFVQNAWMRFFFEGKADNGLTYGWYVRIMGTSSTISAHGFSNDRELMYFRHPTSGTAEGGHGSSTGKPGFPFVRADWGPSSSSQSYPGPDGKLE